MTDVWQQKHFNRFWQRMNESVGKRFSDEFGSIPNQAWMEALATLSFDQAAHAIKEGIRMGDEHPPTLAKFIYRAKDYGKKVQAAHQDTPKLSKPEITEEQIKKNRERMMSLAHQSNKPAKRCVFLPGELPHHFEAAKAKALKDGITEDEFTLQRLEANGWSREREMEFRQRQPQHA